MDDLFEKFMVGLLAICGVLIVTLICLGVSDALSTADGTVVNKYYDDPDLICSKGCIRTSECWTIVVDSEPWWNKDTCVSESEYHAIKIGDNFRE